MEDGQCNGHKIVNWIGPDFTAACHLANPPAPAVLM